jgi:hypothetical protein
MKCTHSQETNSAPWLQKIIIAITALAMSEEVYESNIAKSFDSKTNLIVYFFC